MQNVKYSQLPHSLSKSTTGYEDPLMKNAHGLLLYYKAPYAQWNLNLLCIYKAISIQSQFL